jgi:hypothetical protein
MAGQLKDHMYVHSKCCGGHWELCFDMHKKRWYLECPQCGKEAGGIILAGPELDGKCDCCEKEVT